jgi:hypothetical protein
MSTIWAVMADSGCPANWDGGRSACVERRGQLFNRSASVTYQGGNDYTLNDTTSMKNYGFKNEAIQMAFDTVTLDYPQSGGKMVGTNVIWEFASLNYTLQGLVGLHQPPVNLSDLGGMGYGNPSFIQTLSTQNNIPSVSYGYTAGALYRT